MLPTRLRIAVLDCDIPVPNVYADRGLYSDIFAALLQDAAAQIPGFLKMDLSFVKYDCILGELPSEEELSRIDTVIITGSAASAYESVPWVVALVDYTKDLYTLHPRIKIFGSCFGHQVICHALFSLPSQPVVCRDPAGWEVGIQPTILSAPFLSHYGPVLSNAVSQSQLRLQFVHADHVVLSPSQLQSLGFESIGRSAHCALQGVWKKGRVLTYQGHAEFDSFINGETLTVFGKLIWSEEVLKSALQSVLGEDDAGWAAGVILRFFLESEIDDSRDMAGGDVDIAQEEDVTARL